MMKTHKLLAILKEYKNQVSEEYGLQEIGIFGSFARAEASDNSDVDVVIRVRKPDLFMLAGIKSDLEELLNRPVDIVTYRETMNQFLKKRIDGETIYA
jgi:predicted nucleotidyltransferase